jgi:threonine/homoserine/homoserine lactone efflux protein
MIIICILKGIGFGFIGSVGLGPITILTINRTLGRGLPSGFVTGAGAALSDTFYAALAAFGITLIIDLLEQYEHWFQMALMIVLLIIGSSMLFFKPSVTNLESNTTKRLRSDFITSFFLAISNPFMVLVFMGLFGFFNAIEGEPSAGQVLALLLGVFIGANTYWFGLTRIIRLVGRKFNDLKLQYIKIAAGIAMIILGIIAGIKAISSMIA